MQVDLHISTLKYSKTVWCKKNESEILRSNSCPVIQTNGKTTNKSLYEGFCLFLEAYYDFFL